MAQRKEISDILRPRVDDAVLWNIISPLWGNPALFVAHDLKIFALLAERKQTLEEICQILQIKERPAKVLLAMLVSLGLVDFVKGQYSLTPVSQEYLVETSPTYYGGVLEAVKANYAIWSPESLKKAILTNKPQVYGGKDMWASHGEDEKRADMFTMWMHSESMGPALALREVFDFSPYSLLLDVGGGSGAFSIASVLRNPHLHAIILDIPSVCKVANKIISQYGLEDYITTHAGDMFTEPFPKGGDVVLYSKVFHDWSYEKCQFLVDKAFKSLPPRGAIIIQEMLYNDAKTGPSAVAAFDIVMLLWTEGQMFSGSELGGMLQQAGFVDIQVRPTAGYWGIVTGRKP